MRTTICFLNDQFLPYEQATVHVSDLAIQRGFAVFDFFREIEGRVPFLEDYLDRFFVSAEALGLTVPLERYSIRQNIFRLLEENGFRNSGIKLILTGGNTEDFLTPVKPNFIILNTPFKELPQHYLQGVKLMLFEYQRYLSEIKSINYFLAVWLLPRLREAGAIEPLFHSGGRLLETSRGNIFIVRDGILATPAENILMGIMRKHLIHLARKNFRVEERDVMLDEIQAADEAFITGTTKHVLPIVQIDDIVIGNGRPGPVTLQLMDEFERYISDCS